MALLKPHNLTGDPMQLAQYALVIGGAGSPLTGGSPVTGSPQLALPSASRHEGSIVFVSNIGGSPALGTVAFSNGTDWINLTTGDVVGASENT